MSKVLIKRIKNLEKSQPPPSEKIDELLLKALESEGIDIKARITDESSLDYSSQDKFERSILSLLTIDELEALAEKYRLEESE